MSRRRADSAAHGFSVAVLNSLFIEKDSAQGCGAPGRRACRAIQPFGGRRHKGLGGWISQRGRVDLGG